MTPPQEVQLACLLVPAGLETSAYRGCSNLTLAALASFLCPAMAPVQGGPSSLGGLCLFDLSVGTTGCTFSGKGRNWKVTLSLVCRLPLAACQLPWCLRLGVGFLRVLGEHGGDWSPGFLPPMTP